MKRLSAGVCGGGFVGEATSLFGCEEIEVKIFDKNPDRCVPKNTTMKDIANCDVVFVAVNTPMHKSGKCCTSIVETVIDQIKEENPNAKIVIRSTVPPGTSERLNVSFMPEFLTEKSYLDDFYNCKDWVFGSEDQEVINLVKEIVDTAHKYKKIKYNNFHVTKTKEAELCKYIKNSFLATKVSFFNEIYEYCQVKEIDYESAKNLACLDERIGNSHTTVPNIEYGSDKQKFGYGGHCLSKDLPAISASMKESGMDSFIINNVILRNKLVDRPDQDWNKMKGRAVVD